MALSKEALVLLVSRFLTLFFACASLKVFTYDPSNLETPFPMSAFATLDLALGCHITASVVELAGQLVSVIKGWDPLPGDSGLRVSVIILDLVLSIFTLSSASAVVGVTADFAMSKHRKLWHGGLACLAGLSGFVTAVYSSCISVAPAGPAPPAPQQPNGPQP